jgi:hypothetical protein
MQKETPWSMRVKNKLSSSSSIYKLTPLFFYQMFPAVISQGQQRAKTPLCAALSCLVLVCVLSPSDCGLVWRAAWELVDPGLNNSIVIQILVITIRFG